MLDDDIINGYSWINHELVGAPSTRKMDIYQIVSGQNCLLEYGTLECKYRKALITQVYRRLATILLTLCSIHCFR